jgi:hypothetical protein
MELELNEGLVYGARYYTVHPVIKPVWDVNPQEWITMMEWCITTFGPTPKDGVWAPNSRWYANNAKFWFRNKADQEWFVLRWA